MVRYCNLCSPPTGTHPNKPRVHRTKTTAMLSDCSAHSRNIIDKPPHFKGTEVRANWEPTERH